MIALTAATLFTPLERIEQALLLLEDGVIREVRSRAAYEIPGDCRVIDLSASLRSVQPKRPTVRQPTLFELETPSESTSELNIDRPFSLPGILLGTSAFTANGWQGSFYPPGMKSRDFLSY